MYNSTFASYYIIFVPETTKLHCRFIADLICFVYTLVYADTALLGYYQLKSYISDIFSKVTPWYVILAYENFSVCFILFDNLCI